MHLRFNETSLVYHITVVERVADNIATIKELHTESSGLEINASRHED